MKKKLVYIGLVLALLALPLMAACASEAPAPAPTPAPAPKPAPAPAPPPPPPAATPVNVVWTHAQFAGAGPNTWGFSPVSIYPVWLEQMTDGQIKIDNKMSLVPPGEIITAVIDGRADTGSAIIPFSSGSFPLFDFGSIPFLFNDIMEYYNTITDPDMLDLLEREYGKVGLVYAGEIAEGPQGAIWANKPIATVADFSGVKIRTSGLIQTNTLKILGAAPLTMPVGELANSVARGTIDAVATSQSFGMNIGLADVCTDVSLWDHSSNFGGAMVINQAKFNELPGHLQDIVMLWRNRVTDADVMGIQSRALTAEAALKAIGLNITTPDKSEVDKAIELSQSSVDLWLEKVGDPGREILAIAARHVTSPLAK